MCQFLRQLLLAVLTMAVLQATAQEPANDDCANALPVACGTSVSGSTMSANLDDAPTCVTTVSAPGIWYTVLGVSGSITVSTCAQNDFDTKINVYQGSCDGLQCIGGNDDGGGCGLGSQLTFPTWAGGEYLVLVQGYNGATGTFTLSVDCQQIMNDECTGALPISCGETLDGSTAGATPHDGIPCQTSLTSPAVWYVATDLVGNVVATTCPDPAYDTQLSVYRGTCGTLPCVVGNNDTPGVGTCSTVQFDAQPGETYFFLVHGVGSASGSFSLGVHCTTCPAPTDLDITTTGTQAVVQWTTANPTAQFIIEYGPSGFTPGTGTTITGQNGVDGPPVTISGLTEETDYALYLYEQCATDSSYVSGPTAFTTLGPMPPNAICAGALPITCGNTITASTATGLFTSGPACGPANITSKGLWYTFTGTGEEVTLSTCDGTAYDSKISVFTGSCSAPVCVAGNDDAPGCGTRSRVVFPTLIGTDYLVLVHGYNVAEGEFTLSMSCAPACSPLAEGDQCADAALLTLQPLGACTPTTATNVCAFVQPLANPSCNPFAPIVDVWFRFNSGQAVGHQVLLAATAGQPLNMALYTACAGTEISCTMDVAGALTLPGLALGTDHLLRVWNAGGADAGEFTICVEADLTTGLVDAPTHQPVVLWPVPTNGLVYLDLDGTGQHVVVRDALGRVVLSTVLRGTAPHVIDAGPLVPGSYWLQDTGSGAVIGRMVRE
ncbi:MAG: hypothetical protein IPH05_08160 [Flavobacteriales bacterium]|nr:hypothetical protein [Flavobacteriales bacterium]